MNRATQREFEAMARHVSIEAARVRCTPAEYRDGLLTIIETLRTDLEASKEVSPDEEK